MIAALYVCPPPRGVYFGLDHVDPWDEQRDARKYAGPWPVVAHPPCQRWGRYWHGGPNSARFPRERRLKGDDGGCFAAALFAVRTFGGVLEHPADSGSWQWFGLPAPSRVGGWTAADAFGGSSCHVEQGHYGHRARKGTWLYACGVASLPALIWGPSSSRARLDEGFHSAEERALARAASSNDNATPVERLSKHECLATPLAFRDLLISIAESAAQQRAV